MIKKTTLTLTKILLLFSVLFCVQSNLYAQFITPNILVFDRICAGGVANPTFSASFNYSGFPVGTTFEMELSDKTGSFATGTTILSGVTNNDAPDKITITFSIPSNLVGSDLYSLRVKSSGGFPPSGTFFSSTSKKQFPIYYKLQETQYTINNFVSTASYCTGGSYLLSIDPVSSNPDSPLKHSTLTYNWYKDNGPSLPPTLMAGASGSSYSVTAPGTYYVETNYGSCSSTSYSNRVDVSASGSGSSVTIDSSLGNPFCFNGTSTVLTATSGSSYVWKKDGVSLTPTTRSINASEAGVYTVTVDFGGCTSSGSINLMINGFDASIDVADEIEITEGETVNVTVTDDATNPTYQWFLNGNVISGATTDSYLVAVRGNYKVKISQASGCISSREFSFKVSGPSSPTDLISNIIKLGGANPYWNIPDVYKNENTKVIIISSNGEKVLDVVNYQGDWPDTSIDIKNVNPVYYYVIQGDAGEKKGSITVLK